MATNHIRKVAIVGAGGNVGRFITEALLLTGKHTVTAITRVDSQSKLPSGVEVKRIDYNEQETLVNALQGQDALVITLSGSAMTLETQLINAAAEAEVSWILPNGWSSDTANEALVKDMAAYQIFVKNRNLIEDLGRSSYITICAGFWYQWMLAMPAAFGFDFANRTVTLFDEGDTKICVSTWPQIGRAVASLLSLPINAESQEACLDDFRNKVVYINSFNVSQKDMLESAIRVTGTRLEDWNIGKEPAQERYASGMEDIQHGDRSGYMKLASRVFFSDGVGNFEGKGTLNSVLNLPQESLEEATKVAIERSTTDH